jgi:hypothetical protein
MAEKPVQTYANHAHNPVLTTIGSFCLMVGGVGFALRWFLIGGRVTMAIGIAGLIASQFVLLWISRAYTTKLQDRIIRVEMRVRAIDVLTPGQRRALDGLSIKQIAALRFASDGELPALLERTVRERLAPDDIKRAVTTWVPDYDRT